MAARAAALALAASVLMACHSVCPSGTDPRADPAGMECGTADDCEVRCACADDDLELVVLVVGDCQGGICRGAEELCDAGCGSMELVAYCRAPD